MPAGTFSIYGANPSMISGGVGLVGPLTITGSTASYSVGQIIDVVLATSDNSILTSTAGTAMLIVPAAGIGATLALKTSVGASPFPISNANPSLLSFTSVFPSTAGFVLSAGTSAGSTTLGTVEIRVI